MENFYVISACYSWLPFHSAFDAGRKEDSPLLCWFYSFFLLLLAFLLEMSDKATFCVGDAPRTIREMEKLEGTESQRYRRLVEKRMKWKFYDSLNVCFHGFLFAAAGFFSAVSRWRTEIWAAQKYYSTLGSFHQFFMFLSHVRLLFLRSFF